MKNKSKICLLIVVMTALWLLSGCGNPQTQVTDATHGTTQITENANAAEVLSAEEDARLKEELQKDIDAILSTEAAIIHSDTYIPGETYIGTAYYVSANGNDDNDGLTPETAWQTLKKVSESCGDGENAILQPGDAVFFRRGDIFRETRSQVNSALAIMVDQITFSAYGEGNKPIITGSKENGSGAEKWVLVYEDETGVKIWQYYREKGDVSRLVLNEGKMLATRVYEFYGEDGYVSCEMEGWWQHEDVGVTLKDGLLPLEQSLTEDLTLISRPWCAYYEEFSGYVYEQDSVGPLYFRCDAGNPGEIYASIEFTEWQEIAPVNILANGTVFDNISFQCGGVAYMKNGSNILTDATNTRIQNCEFAYGGGCVMFYQDFPSGIKLVVAQGDGIYNLVKNTLIQNCYFHDSQSSCGTFEHGIAEEGTKVDGYYHFIDNVCVNTNGIRLDSAMEELKYLDSVIIKGNQVWNTGRMDNGKYVYSEGALVLLGLTHYGECIIENNVFYGTKNGGENNGVNGLLNLPSYDYEDPVHAQYTKPLFKNNIYAQYEDKSFGLFLYHSGETWAMDDPELLPKTADLLGDATSKFYIIPAK